MVFPKTRETNHPGWPGFFPVIALMACVLGCSQSGKMEMLFTPNTPKILQDEARGQTNTCILPEPGHHPPVNLHWHLVLARGFAAC